MKNEINRLVLNSGRRGQAAMPCDTAQLTIACSIFLLIGTLAYAHDMVPPDWRGSEGTTHQVWTFDDNDNPAAPEIDGNPYGTATAVIAVGDYGEGWLETLSLGTQTGLWDLGREGTILLDILNRPEALEYKEISIQVTYFDGLVAAPVITIPGATPVSNQTLLVEEDDLGDWKLDHSVWRMEPNPAEEQITLTADYNGSTIDQIVVDTICVPEPATALVFGIGGIALTIRRRWFDF